MIASRFSRPLLLLLVLGLTSLGGCRKEEEEDAYPLWFLGVDVVELTEDGTYVPVSGCPRLLWRYTLDLGADNVEDCQNGSNYVRAYQHIDQPVTVSYRVECEGYFPQSEPRSHVFHPDSAIQRPGRGGPEVYFSDRIALLRQ